MSFLASDALNGRGSGTRDEWIAAVYLAAQLQRFGLEPICDAGFVQPIEIERTQAAAPPVLTIGERRFTHGREMLVQSLAAPSVTGPLQRFKVGDAVRPGAILLMPETPQAAPPAGSANAAAVLTPETPQSRQRWQMLAARLPSLPAHMAGVSPASRRPTSIVLDTATYAIVASLSDGTPIAIEAETKPPTKVSTWNAVGKLTGSDPARASEVILLSAHLDHVGSRTPRDGGAPGDTIYNGADDDASGTVAVLELAQALAEGPRPKRTVVFAFFGSEEAGGFGSRYFADKPVVPLTQIVANLQFEMLGRADAAVPPHTLWLTGYERSTLGPALAGLGAKLVQDPHPDQNFFERSDNIQFARRGVVAHTVSSFGLHTDYHQPSDEIGTIDFGHMTDAIRSLLEPVRWLADSDFRPEWLPGKKPQ